MFKYKWALLVRVACETYRVASRRRPQLLADETTMRVMAIRTLYGPLPHTVVEGHIELRFLTYMTAVADLGLLFDKQRLLRVGMMRGVAT